MIKTASAFGLVALALAAAAPAAAQPAYAHKSSGSVVGSSEPAAVVDQFHAALKRQDTEAAAALLAEEALIYEQGGVEHTRAEYMKAHLPADAGYAAAVTSTTTDRTAHVAGDLAWVVSAGRTTGTSQGRDVNRATTETMILKHTPAGWRIVHVHWSSGAAR